MCSKPKAGPSSSATSGSRHYGQTFRSRSGWISLTLPFSLRLTSARFGNWPACAFSKTRRTSFCSDRRESGKPDQHTTPVDAASAGDELVTIVDPRHALFGQTLLLLEVASKPYRGRCCVVQLREGFCCHVPLSATSRSVEPPAVFPVPLDLPALEQLLTVYQ